jgi:hypothetical protein
LAQFDAKSLIYAVLLKSLDLTETPVPIRCGSVISYDLLFLHLVFSALLNKSVKFKNLMFEAGSFAPLG